MGAAGQVVGFAFFVALAVAGLTSLVSLLEVATASLIDELGVGRKPAAVGAGAVAAVAGLAPALSQDALGVIDQVAGNLLVVAGALGTSLAVGWAMKQPAEELIEGASPFFRRVAPGAIFALRYLVPPLTAWILWLSLRQTAAMMV